MRRALSEVQGTLAARILPAVRRAAGRDILRNARAYLATVHATSRCRVCRLFALRPVCSSKHLGCLSYVCLGDGSERVGLV
jgi:hypothetical protein